MSSLPAPDQETRMGFIDAHVHVWTPDTAHYPLAAGYKKADMAPASFTPQELFEHTKTAGVDRVNLIQMSYYGFDNSYMLDMLALHKDVFVGTAVIDPGGEAPDKLMTELAKQRVRAFRIYPGLERRTKPNVGPGDGWLKADGYDRMFAAGAKNNQAMSCLINPDALLDLDRMCAKHPRTPVIVDHLCRIGSDGTVRDKDVEALCGLARHKRVMVKVGAFYAPGQEVPAVHRPGPADPAGRQGLRGQPLPVGERLSVSGGRSRVPQQLQPGAPSGSISCRRTNGTGSCGRRPRSSSSRPRPAQPAAPARDVAW